MSSDPYQHMEDAWQLDENPFPQDAVSDDETEPYAELYPDETLDFQRKFIRGGIAGLKLGYLWSRNPSGDTGFGKTRLMRHMRTKINSDLGETVEAEAGMRKERRVPIAAAFATFNNTTATGLYHVFYAGLADMNISHEGAVAPLAAAHAEIVRRLARDLGVAVEDVAPDQVARAVVASRRSMAPGGAPLRADFLSAFASGVDELAVALSEVSEATRMRSGIQFLDFALAALGAANIDHLFLFIDQLEDLATNPSITAAKRGREIGRIRDLLEEQPYASRLHQVLTFHQSASIKLARFWEPVRLPRFDIAPDNMSVIVELGGMTSDEQAVALLKAYLEPRRLGPVVDDLMPFELGAVTVLRQVAMGRVGILLSRAHELFHAAATAGVETIDAAFATALFSGTAITQPGDGRGDPASTTAGIDDLLLA